MTIPHKHFRSTSFRETVHEFIRTFIKGLSQKFISNKLSVVVGCKIGADHGSTPIKLNNKSFLRQPLNEETETSFNRLKRHCFIPNKPIIFFVLMIFYSSMTSSQVLSGFQIARLKYNGGGDWYNDPSAEVNLLNFAAENMNISVKAEYVFVDISSDDIFNYPFIFVTGHGNIVLSDTETERLRTYLELGGFLYVDDDYGLDKSFRREIKKVFPENDFIELPFSHGIYHCAYEFPNGPPKTHEHDKKPPQGFGLHVNKRLAVYYTYESNPSDGWADAEVYNDPPAKREESLKFGTNIIVWALSN